MKHLGDIKKIYGYLIEPVDCIAGGSPCQDLSIAGKRAGLAGERSGLFMEMIRVIKEMRDSTNGEYPKFAIWENVKGAFSSNNGEDFRCVLEEFAHIVEPNVAIPRPSGKNGKWYKSGAISGNGWSLAWRLLDAQYWGVPQRRKRIALVVDFRGQRAAEILFERTELSRNPDEGIKEWQSVAGIAQNRTTGNGQVVGAKSFSLQGNMIGRKDENGPQGCGVNEDVSSTLNTTDNHAVAYAEESYVVHIPVLNDQGGSVMGVTYDVIGTLRAQEHGHQPIVFENHAQDARYQELNEVSPTVTARCETCGRNTPPVVKKTFSEQAFYSYKENDKSATLKARAGSVGNGGECLIAEKAMRWIVRRLTPVEYERLQGFPDNWTNIGDWTDSKGKKHKCTDSPRYKALGNSIALPQWFWLIQKMRPYLKDKPTIGSLFDGIGGFPLVWETAYGNGTAKWASEIEEFPIAVTKARFPN